MQRKNTTLAAMAMMVPLLFGMSTSPRRTGLGQRLHLISQDLPVGHGGDAVDHLTTGVLEGDGGLGYNIDKDEVNEINRSSDPLRRPWRALQQIGVGASSGEWREGQHQRYDG